MSGFNTNANNCHSLETGNALYICTNCTFVRIVHLPSSAHMLAANVPVMISLAIKWFNKILPQESCISPHPNK